MYVCICNKVTDTDIREAVNQGMNSMELLSRQLKVGSCCGKCKNCAKRVLREAKAEQTYLALTTALQGGLPEPTTA